MTQEQLDRLNKKLAEWAGFKVVPYKSWEYWTDPIKHIFYSNDTPNFTQSLDACFKWLLPKLLGYYIFQQGKHHCAAAIPYGDADVGLCTDGDTPALALCLAIEKLIDKEEK